MSVFPNEQYAAPRSWTERAYPKLIYYNRWTGAGTLPPGSSRDSSPTSCGPRSRRCAASGGVGQRQVGRPPRSTTRQEPHHEDDTNVRPRWARREPRLGTDSAASTREASTPEPATREAELRAAIATFRTALNGGDSVAFFGLLAPDLEVFAPGAHPIRGAEARESFRPPFTQVKPDIGPFTNEEITLKRDIAIQRHSYRLSTTPRVGWARDDRGRVRAARLEANARRPVADRQGHLDHPAHLVSGPTTQGGAMNTLDGSLVVCGIVGSLRRGSYNHALLRAAGGAARPRGWISASSTAWRRSRSSTRTWKRRATRSPCRR